MGIEARYPKRMRMKIECAAFTAKGVRLALQIEGFLRAGGDICTVHAWGTHAEKGTIEMTSLAKWTAEAFSRADALVFVSACGIAVRSIAPHLRSKFTDPAVVAVDDCGRFVVPLVSGHVGGANVLAKRIARGLGAQAVVTTATDANRVFAVDTWAVQNGFLVMRPKAAKAVSAALLNGDTVGVFSDFPVGGALPTGLVFEEEGAVGIRISLTDGADFDQTCWLIPRILTLGIGCKRGTDRETIAEAVNLAMQANDLYMESVQNIASIDKKSHEIGLLDFCKGKKLVCEFFSAAELSRVKGAFVHSEFVEKTVGVDNVCERAAVLGSGGGTLLVHKTAHAGVTVAVAAAPLTIRFLEKEETVL